MIIAVCVKQVNNEINPFDACALEAALEMASGIEGSEVVVVSMGRPPGCGNAEGIDTAWSEQGGSADRQCFCRF